MNFILSPGNKHDAKQGCLLLSHLPGFYGKLKGIPLVIDRAYDGGKTRKIVIDMGFKSIVPPKLNRLTLWNYDRKFTKNVTKLNVYFEN